MAVAGYARTPYSPTRFPAGVTNSNVGDFSQQLGKPDETKFFTDFDDFIFYTATQWTVGGAPTAAGAAGFGGILSATVTAAEGTFRRAQAQFLATPGKQIFFAFKASAADVLNTTFWAGLFNAGATPADATDGIYFHKPDAVNTVNVSVRVNATTGANNETALGEIVDATPFVLGFWYDGKQTVRFYQDNNLIASLDASTTYLPDAALQLAFGVDDGAGGTNEVLLIDYVYCCQER